MSIIANRTRSCMLPFVAVVGLLLWHPSAVAELPRALPGEVSMRGALLDQIDNLVHKGISEGKFPGCVVMIGRRGRVVLHRAYGDRQLLPSKLPMQIDTVFDVASITKPIATATSAMILLEQGKLRLQDRVSSYIPEFANSGKESVTIQQLLTHQAGFVPDNSISDYRDGRKKAFENIYELKAIYDPGTRFVYSDVGFVVLGDLIERQSGMRLDRFAEKHIFKPLGMSETGYLPAESLRERAATTEQRESRWMKGEVHDPRAYLMDGVAGHAGLFSTADDLAVYAQMMLQRGIYDGNRVLSGATVDLMCDGNEIVEGDRVSVRGLGWDKKTGYSSNRGETMSPFAFGHGGFTGTVLWIDPQHDLFFIFLSNRVHPNGKGSVNRLAGQIATLAVSAIDETSDRKLPGESKLSSVQLGIDHLVASDFEAIDQGRIGLITNHTGYSSSGDSTIKLLRDATNVDLVALFSPEHGLAGKLDQSIIGDQVDKKSGLTVFSLYGKTRQPTKEQLSNIETLVFDIQDIGCRFYTYISTMGLAMQAAAQHEKRFVVLDRPNPIGGQVVAGPLPDEGSNSFVCFHSIPIRHGMTVGELALMFKKELGLPNLELEIVPCQNWERELMFDQTGLKWINPSPNMRNLNEAILYPGIGVWETTNLSVGRGTDTPFEVLGAPWIESREFAKQLNAEGIPGIAFTARDFVPEASRYAGETCGGVQLSITHRDAFDPIHCGVALACVLYRLYPDDWELDRANRLLSNQDVLEAIVGGQDAAEIMKDIASQAKSFRARREPFLIYEGGPGE